MMMIKIVEVSWGSEKISGRYATELQIKAEDRFGILTEAINLLNEAKNFYKFGKC